MYSTVNRSPSGSDRKIDNSVWRLAKLEYRSFPKPVKYLIRAVGTGWAGKIYTSSLY